VWIEHGERRTQSDLPPELLAAERWFGRSWNRIGRDTGSWLCGFLDQDQRRAAASALTKENAGEQRRAQASRLAPEGCARFSRSDSVSCALAVGHVLRHAGLQAEARAGYGRLQRECPDDLRIALSWAEATFELNEFDDAIDVFRRVRADDSDPEHQAKAVLGEVEALRDLSRFDEARVALDGLQLLSNSIQQPRHRAAVRAAGELQRGGMARMDGDLAAADDAYERALRSSLSAGDARSALEARTWRTEVLLARGMYPEAVATSTTTLDYAPFANARWLSWAEFVHCEALCAAGERDAGLDGFCRVLDGFAQYGNPQGEAWTLLAEASFRRLDDPPAARRVLKQARSAIARSRTPLAYASARLLWEEAEVARAGDQLSDTHEGLQAYRSHVSRMFPHGHAWLAAHGDALEVELLRAADAADVAARAGAVETVYRSLGAEGAARRMELSRRASSTAGPAVPRRAVAREWARRGYALEVEAGRRLTQGSYAPLNVWFIP
jgi:tetratricopeptide (TPR) repeat protein